MSTFHDARTLSIHDCKSADDVQEIIALPEFDVTVNHQIVDAADIVIPPVVVEQLEAYVTWVASMYKSNPFHSFDHASHVVMSVIKLMSRIVAPTDQHMNDNAATLHDHTYGITTDPLTQFACVFSALIHDVDHSGVPNTTLEKRSVTIDGTRPLKFIQIKPNRRSKNREMRSIAKRRL
jgi:hypothetical protein